MFKKVIYATVLMALCAINAGAQSWRWGIEGGLNVSRPINANGARVGFNAGVKGIFDLNPTTNNWYFDAAVKLSSKPSKYIGETGFFDAGATLIEMPSTVFEERSTPYYLDIPIHAGYHFNVGQSVKIFAGVGPYLAVGLFGPSTYSLFKGLGGWNDTKINNVFKSSYYNDAMKRFDVGLSACVGMEFFDHIQFSVGYDLGFIELDNSLYNQNISFSVAYIF